MLVIDRRPLNVGYSSKKEEAVQERAPPTLTILAITTPVLARNQSFRSQPQTVLPRVQRGDILAVVLPRTRLKHLFTGRMRSPKPHSLASSHHRISPVVSKTTILK